MKNLKLFEGEGVWRTIGGRRVFIRNKQNLADAMMESGKFKKEKDEIKNEKDLKSITSEEKEELIRIRNEKLIKLDEEEKKEMAGIQKLKEINYDEYSKKEYDIYEKYHMKRQELIRLNIYDEKEDRFIMLDKSDIVFNNKEHQFNYNEKYEEQQFKKMSDEAKKAINEYTTSYGAGNYSAINSYLYNPEKGFYSNTTEEIVKNNIKLLDNTLKNSKLGQDCYLYRGIETDKLDGLIDTSVLNKTIRAIKKGGIKGSEKILNELNNLKGKVIENKGYVSTSTFSDKNYAQRGVELVIDAKSNDEALHISSLSNFAGQRNTAYLPFYSGPIQVEDEVLLNRNTNFKIKKVALTGEGIKLLVEIMKGKK